MTFDGDEAHAAVLDKLRVACERVGLLTGQLAWARRRISDLESKIGDEVAKALRGQQSPPNDDEIPF